ncbi:monocarboxylate transporter 13-like isoform X1 [Lytechinus variegatus]|uniref:monocarboxylate transporter 13-like isoform X1 n=1 Tax=Lytechinus variegatus TaxID=7654 RepID=UPI001BB2CEC3|nr:monocarboxylate transporter 13-like isoform X1 [Lytechinus variegatus]
MTPHPNNNSLYDACTPGCGQLVSWKDDPSPAVFEANPIGTIRTVHQDEAATPGGCKTGALKMISFFKELWTNPRYFRWVMTIATSMVFTIVVGFFNAFGPLYMCLRRDLNSTAIETGWVASLGWSIGITSPFVNSLYQRYGPRKIAILAAIFCSTGILSSSFATSIWPLFVTFGLVFGFGVNLVITGSMSLIASHFDSNDCALPTTLPGIGSSLGALICCPVLEIAYEHFGWRNTLRFLAALMFVICLSCAVVYKRPASAKGTTNASQTATEDTSLKALLTLSNIPSTSAATMPSAGSQKRKSLLIKLFKGEDELKRERRLKSRQNYIKLVKDPIHWMFCVASMLSNVCMVFNVINLVEMMDSEGYSPQRSATFMSILSFVEMGFRLLTGIFGDRLPCARTLLFPVVCIMCACATFSLTLSSSAAIIITYVCVAGMGRAVSYSIVFSASIETFGHSVHQESFSMILVSYGISCLLAAVIPGLSFDLTGSYTPANYCGAVLWLISSALYLAVYVFNNRRNRLRALRYSSILQRSSDNNEPMVKVDTCAPITVAHTLNEKDVDLEGAPADFEVDARDAVTVVAQEYMVVVDIVSTV